jgi:hypothetical protein
MEKYGFVYIWRDRKHNRYYIGSHWGTEDDGYVCSSNWMMQAYKKRPYDFKRKILSRGIHTRDSLLYEEFRYLLMIKPEELGKRYYNLKNTKDYYWHTETNTRLTIAEKISIRTKEAMQRPEVRAKYENSLKTRDNRSSDTSVIEKRRQSMIKTMSEKFPEENRRKPLTEDERKRYYSEKAIAMHANRSVEQKATIGEKIARSNIGKKMRLGQTNLEEHRQKISQSLKGKIHPRHTVSVDGVVYESTVKAAEVLGLSVATINRRLSSHKYPEYIRIGG